jgi:hypothetical protein
MSEVAAGIGGGQTGDGKRPYEPPKVLGLSAADEGRGVSYCWNGSGNVMECSVGNSASGECSTGNAFFM